MYYYLTDGCPDNCDGCHTVAACFSDGCDSGFIFKASDSSCGSEWSY